MKAAELRNLTNEELMNLLEEKKRTLMNLRFQNVLGQLTDYSQISKTRKDIARIKTILRERELGVRR
ncbi:50S ribosomal protein L29 [Thermosipho africanus H17ap60334]|jgi:large subunit ribosomal protein L29|uniref:Large ribosomal subunit protein uL29 n=2 Tax=Thermosipho TaxID=2420 RepID=RL29_THEAB|nr:MULTISPECIES: 50S ribosomal protein L29 [Thermosipho]B7IHV4.1 RecName: Full=Large ribosomal subunit protein uL29; AltName: Full=50S ribosomal protein L29 [Thermosipho africanus TCF52B]HCF38481.1 50S ribosomal protein L29 [Thermosipho africanus]ACJ75668.1 ribosomal protein L29 [Thermosipho africanus TCF52B]EKF49691.1 50S ribosomal protein L29 [Thermosipho africanus H17ap60334]MBB6062228.1 large subunit ribosomal protein L29 [Thermosipho japonicus]MBZ4650530.1 rpmC [Thermosipho sp. (in: ther